MSSRATIGVAARGAAARSRGVCLRGTSSVSSWPFKAAARSCDIDPPLPPALPTVLQGFDEYMNVVLDDAEEVDSKKKTRKPIGRIMIKGENITLLAPSNSAAPPPPAPAAASAETRAAAVSGSGDAEMAVA